MTIALASDHAGYALKNAVKDHLLAKGLSVEDFGCFSEERVDYVDFARKALEAMIAGDCSRGVFCCGTGLGMSIVANKYPGIRAALCCDEYMAEMSRRHNDANCLTMGGRILPQDEALQIVDVWLETEYEDGRHQCRLDKILEIERRNFQS